ncbi:hypothetical protein, partial [Pseudomonas syringae]|uniref:hypothetical protein n=1 Tax=Pseudomonas syringae TaxID=317 RepID=UPI0019676621
MLAANAKLFKRRKYPVLLARVAYGYQCHVTQSVTKMHYHAKACGTRGIPKNAIVSMRRAQRNTQVFVGAS